MHYSQYLTSRDRSLSVEDRVVLHKVGTRTNIGHLNSSHLPNLKLNSFDRNQLDWLEWSSMFVATEDKRTIIDSDKISHMKMLQQGKIRNLGIVIFWTNFSFLEKKWTATYNFRCSTRELKKQIM